MASALQSRMPGSRGALFKTPVAQALAHTIPLIPLQKRFIPYGEFSPLKFRTSIIHNQGRNFASQFCTQRQLAVLFAVLIESRRNYVPR
jgi:hypothetical protein